MSLETTDSAWLELTSSHSSTSHFLSLFFPVLVNSTSLSSTPWYKFWLCPLSTPWPQLDLGLQPPHLTYCESEIPLLLLFSKQLLGWHVGLSPDEIHTSTFHHHLGSSPSSLTSLPLRTSYLCSSSLWTSNHSWHSLNSYPCTFAPPPFSLPSVLSMTFHLSRPPPPSKTQGGRPLLYALPCPCLPPTVPGLSVPQKGSRYPVQISVSFTETTRFLVILFSCLFLPDATEREDRVLLVFPGPFRSSSTPILPIGYVLIWICRSLDLFIKTTNRVGNISGPDWISMGNLSLTFKAIAQHGKQVFNISFWHGEQIEIHQHHI